MTNINKYNKYVNDKKFNERVDKCKNIIESFKIDCNKINNFDKKEYCNKIETVMIACLIYYED